MMRFASIPLLLAAVLSIATPAPAEPRRFEAILFDDLSPFPRYLAAADDRHAHRVLEIVGSSAPPQERLHYPESSPSGW